VRVLRARDGRDATRVAFSVSRRAGGAVDRNRIRRRLRAAMRDHAATLPPGAYLVGAGREALTMPFVELHRLVGEAARHAGESR
jgi:ribonuclease P protein component